MGLAASQGRLLTLTAHKSNLEGQMSDIADQKILLARQAAAASKRYSNALNQTKLVWNTGAATEPEDLTYNLFMSPTGSAKTGGNYLLTNSAGSILLSDEYLNKFGIAATVKSGKIGDFSSYAADAYTFAAKMMDLDPATNKDKIKAAVETSNLDEDKKSDPKAAFKTKYSDADVFSKMAASNKGLVIQWGPGEGTTSLFGATDQVVCIFKDGSDNDKITDADKAAMRGSAQGAVNTITETAAASVLDVLGAKDSDYKTELQAAADKAREATLKFYMDNYDKAKTATSGVQTHDGDRKKSNDETFANAAKSNAFWDDTHGEDELYINVGEVVRTFLNFFDGYCASFADSDATNNGTLIQTGYADQNQYGEAVKTKRGANGGTGGTDAGVSAIAPPDTSGGGTTGNDIDVTTAKFYVSLYNSIKEHGWVRINSTGGDYLESQILNGNMLIKKAKIDGGMTTLSTGSADCPLESVEDEEAINQAKADQEAEKDQIDYKESILDIQMKDLDQERSATETIIESTKKIVDKNTEKFKLFDA